MSDLVERLRFCFHYWDDDRITAEAADEIERLTRELAEAREALRDTTENGLIYWAPQTSRGAVNLARMRERNRAVITRLDAEEPK